MSFYAAVASVVLSNIELPDRPWDLPAVINQLPPHDAIPPIPAHLLSDPDLNTLLPDGFDLNNLTFPLPPRIPASDAFDKTQRRPTIGVVEIKGVNDLLKYHHSEHKKGGVRIVEFGGIEHPDFSVHDSVVTWNTITHDPSFSFPDLKKISVSLVTGQFPHWTNGQTTTAEVKEAARPAAEYEEGTAAEYEKYINELARFGDAKETEKDKDPYWVLAFGRARVDVGIAALPLLSRTGGLLLVSGWRDNSEIGHSTCLAESLLQFYDEVRFPIETGKIAVLRPKPAAALLDHSHTGPGTYDWCFSWGSGQKVVRHSQGSVEEAEALEEFQSRGFGCASMEDDFYCNDAGCLPCTGAFMAIKKRGRYVKESVAAVVKPELAARALERVNNEL